MNEQPERSKSTFQLASKLAAIKASPLGQPSDFTVAKTLVPQYVLENCEAVASYSKKLAHNLSQPMTVLLSTLEMGMLTAGLDTEDCHLLFEQVLQMRKELKLFSETVAGMHSRF